MMCGWTSEPKTGSGCAGEKNLTSAAQWSAYTTARKKYGDENQNDAQCTYITIIQI